ncbi:glycine dehydrogenase (decarboxylating) alpha subunit [Seinonella peptonophila]|uniref:Probable glycine dehydrogenase (decarboxylating) subunit 1 n=1 Tax=Seinonella peptonophila TaxID=112248 RepID=A0A1M4TPX6_9BACL|nr:aminomethyl-transferring glycine dehydrogenase subunit GcvPA [Seinonella peptonophila]SHE46337.1 glycine dehydrogenase (decarboxylating) alpha subunit [Seinonella peptonophila]
MKYRYLPTTDQDRQEMLEKIGVRSIEELFSDIPSQIRLKRSYQLPEPLAEFSLMKHMKQLANMNQSLEDYTSFLGAGVYQHHIPSVVGHIISRSEFYTAYTPYQPEISQGELQAIFEFQTMIAELTGMEVANSSMYDGATALAEAANVAAAVTKQKKILISGALHPESREVLQTQAKGFGLQLIDIPLVDEVTNLEILRKSIDDQTAAVIVQFPNFYGSLETFADLAELIHQHKGLFIVQANPMALAIIEPPGAWGADIVVGDAQPFGIPTSYGGPHCGFFTTTKKLMRKIPGRIVGQTVDEDGNRGYVLTLQAREQHIRRDKATSNICSNQALNALAAAVYMSTFGKEGLQQVAKLNYDKAHYAAERLTSIPGVSLVNQSPFFHEFVIHFSKPAAAICRDLLSKKIFAGFDLGKIDLTRNHQLLVAVTEVRTKAEIDQFAVALEGVL